MFFSLQGLAAGETRSSSSTAHPAEVAGNVPSLEGEVAGSPGGLGRDGELMGLINVHFG